MRALSTAASVVRHSLGALGEGLLIGLIIAALLLALAPVYGPARFLTGSGVADAGGKQAYGLEYQGFRVWNEPYALADFSVSRTRVDSTDVWVKANCVDSTGAQAIPGAAPYGHVKWSSADPLSGIATLDSVKKGSTCEVWLTKSWKQSTDAAPGWPETYLFVDW